jgi:hypothetical protein
VRTAQCTLLKPCPFTVLNRRLLCLLRFTYPTFAIHLGFILAYASTLCSQPLHYFKLQLNMSRLTSSFFSFSFYFSPLVLFVYYCCTMNQSNEPCRHCMKRNERTEGTVRQYQSIGCSLGLDSSCGTDINVLHAHMRGCG